MAKKSAKRSCSRGNKRGSIVVKGHKSRGKSISCYRRRKPVKSHKKSHSKRSQKK